MMFPLQTVEIESFRAIRHARIELDPRVTVLFGSNAAGKTTVLDALAIGLGRIVERFPKAEGRKFAASGDIRIPWQDNPDWGDRRAVEKPFARIQICGQGGIAWDTIKYRSAKQDRKRAPAPLGNRALAEALDPLIEEVLNAPPSEATAPLPLVAAYGTERALVEVPLRERGFLRDFHRFGGFDQALRSRTRFKAVFEWFRSMEDEERRQQSSRRNFDYRLPALEWVRKAVATAGLRCRHPRVETQPIRMIVDFEHDEGVFEQLDITSLSDGYRTHFSLIVDLARRMAQVNPSDDIDDPRRGTRSDAVVLIDEIDLHLHPEWQGRVVAGLLEAFPNTQFILTTHSEQVIGSVKKESVRQLTEADGEVFVEGVEFAQGATNESILVGLMGAPERVPGQNTDLLNEYLRLVDSGRGRENAAVELRSRLEKELPPADPALHAAELEMQKRELLARLAAKP